LPTSAQIRNTIETWYHLHGAALLLFGTALAGDRGRAQDALHQLFLKLLEYTDLSQVTSVRTYLFSAYRNTIISRARRLDRDLSLGLVGDSWFGVPNRNYVEELDLRQALASLPADQREVTILHIWGGLTFSEAAEVLGINPNTAAARYRYALAKLQDYLSEKKEQPANERPNR
jgi:RNA polymerase sigma-70 factor (ECF subfamily)